MTVNGETAAVSASKGYLPVRRVWKKGDVVKLSLPMPAERVYANPSVSMDVARVALSRGPLIYCVEEADNPGRPVQRLKLPRGAALKSDMRDDLFGGAVTLTADAAAIKDSDWKDTLYRNAAPQEEPARLTAIPYYLWSNRGQGSMLVWVPEA